MAAAAAAPLLVTMLAAAAAAAAAAAPRQPHIVMIVADDLGWNDVSFHGSDQIFTPNIDALAYHGVILNNHYALPLCTPSRAALMTGKYPIRTGMQHNVILEAEPWGLPLEERLLPQYLKELGYSTHAIGKWHLGFFRSEYTPTFRGFDSHIGYWNGHQDYFSHNVQATFAPFEGYDMRRNLTVCTEARGYYSTRFFTEEAVALVQNHDARRPLFLYVAHLATHAGNLEAPLQAPADTIARFAHIEDPQRRTYAAMVYELDQSVGAIVQALQDRGMLENSVVVFVSDNGAPTRGIHATRGSNWPFKGVKGTPWEGGVRTVACIWSPRLRASRRVSTQLMHIADWLPTLYSLAGGNVSALGVVDGVDAWQALSEGGPSPRREVLLNLDDAAAYAALRIDHLKYVNERTMRLVPRLFIQLVKRVPGPAGTTLLGFLDDWHESPSARADPPYNAAGVLASATAAALRAAAKAAAARAAAGAAAGADAAPGNGDSADGESPKPLDAAAVRRLRAASVVRCAGADPRSPPCRPRREPCLFDVERDPCEQRNLYTVEMARLFERRLAQFRGVARPPGNRRADRRADPALWGGVWSSWGDKMAVAR